MAAEEATAQVVAAAEGPPEQMTYDEFLAWADEDTHAEWVNGRVVLMSPVSDEHQCLGLWLVELFAGFVRRHRLGRVFYAEFQMKLGPELSGREPDLMFVKTEHLDRVQRNRLDGPADLVIEIISPESLVRDRAEKFDEYALAGVPEYWLLDPMRRLSNFYQLGEDGRYQEVPPDADGVYHSREISGLWIRVDWLWEQPDPDEVLATLDAAA